MTKSQTSTSRAQAKASEILETSGLISFWSFQDSGVRFRSAGPGIYDLESRGPQLPVVQDSHAPLGRYAIQFGSGGWLEVPRNRCPLLNIHGPQAEVSIVAWIKRTQNPSGGCEAVAGMWNEHGRRQYCLFLNLEIHESSQQVGAHISSIGGATPGFKYCMDAAIGATPVPLDIWQCVAITYGGGWASAWLDGRLDCRGTRNPYHYPNGIFDAGPKGADFTVGAVARPERVEIEDGVPLEIGNVQSNLFNGLLGGLAVFNRCLEPSEITALAAPGGGPSSDQGGHDRLGRGSR
jgi:hypothetical protein